MQGIRTHTEPITNPAKAGPRTGERSMSMVRVTPTTTNHEEEGASCQCGGRRDSDVVEEKKFPFGFLTRMENWGSLGGNAAPTAATETELRSAPMLSQVSCFNPEMDRSQGELLINVQIARWECLMVHVSKWIVFEG
jgi:hypothetical protein